MIVYPNLSQAGRLGNQLWEIASTVGIAEREGDKPGFPAWDYQPFFSVPEDFFDVDFSAVTRSRDATVFVGYMDRRARAYLQDYSLFARSVDTVKRYFKPSPLALSIMADDKYAWLNDFDLKNMTALHVRRGDNVTHPEGYHPLRSVDYYSRALSVHPDSDVIVFSDDPDWCETAFAGMGFHFFRGVARPREYVDRAAYDNAEILDWIDLQFMARCGHHIISNSTYAWWGAFLSDDPQPIYPSHWFGRLISEWTDASLMFPPNWLQLDDPTQGGV